MNSHPSNEKRTPPKKFTYRILASAAVINARVSQALFRAIAALGDVLIGVLETSLDTREKEHLTLRLYNTASEQYAASGGLFPWEASWYSRVLPPPPARILVTAAGSGREAAALIHSGYAVDAAEPVDKFTAECAGLRGIGDFFKADHDDIVEGFLHGTGPAAALRGRTYDAVIIGWGSFAHIIDPEKRRQLLDACHALAPRGPILLSFFADTVQINQETRPIRFGRATGRLLARLRKVSPALNANDLFLWHAGFLHRYTEEELVGFANPLGRSVTFSADPYGHATFLPKEMTPEERTQQNANFLRDLRRLCNL